MSVLRLYKDEALTEMVSLDGDYTSPDEETSLDGTNGDSAEKALWAAVEQTTLAAEIPDADSTAVSLAAARFADPGYDVILVGEEKMLIAGGHGGTSLTVVRGHNGTPRSAHAAGSPVRLAYDCTSVSIDCVDTLGTDESGWVSYCLDSGGAPDGNWQAPLALGGLNFDRSLKLWRRVVVPSATPAAYKQDLVHRLAATVNETI
jgi:hypothetical protein